MISTFHKDHLENLTATSTLLDTAPPMARPKVKSTKPLKRKQGRPAKRRATKRVKWNEKESIRVNLIFWS